MKNINEKIKKLKNYKQDKHKENHIQVHRSLIVKAKNVINLLLIITLNVNGINAAIKRQTLLNGLKKQDPTLQVTHLSFKVTNRIKVKGWKKDTMQTHH